MLTWYVNCDISSNAAANQEIKITITDIKLYVPAVTLTQDNAKLLQKLKAGFKCIIFWNKYQCEVSMQRRSQHLDYLIGPNFLGVNIIIWK